MSDILEKEADKAVREYVEALDSYHKLADRYVSVFLGEDKPRTPEPITEAALKELEEAEAKVTETQQKWIESIRRLNAKRQSP